MGFKLCKIINQRMRWLYIIIFLILLDILILAYVCLLPADIFSPVVVNTLISRGSSLDQIANILKENGLIRSRMGFKLVVKFKGYEKTLNAGEYELSSNMSPLRIAEKLHKGEYIRREVKILPCSTVEKLIDSLVQSGLIDLSEAQSAVYSPKIFSKFGLEYPSLEGYIIPDTYYFTRPISGEEIITALLEKFFDLISKYEVNEKAKAKGFSLHEILTLASIIEAEAKDPFEKPLISSVYHNRLKKGMKLQADPTVAYGLKKPGNQLTYQDLQVPNPYNTYLINGLPPSPICFPTLDSILAALDPPSTNYLYFVSDGKGRHRFSVDYQEHLENVKKFRESTRKAN